MKRMLILGLVLVGLLSIASVARDAFVVAIEQSTRGSWEVLADGFESQYGIPVTLRPYPQASIAQQVVLQSFSRSGNLHFSMIPNSWGSSLSAYLEDLKPILTQLEEAGIAPVSIGGKVVGVPLPFAGNWFLAVVSWPDDQQSAARFMISATGASPVAPTGITPSTSASIAAFKTEKIARSAHNPKIDGALDVLLAAAESALSTLAAEALNALPSAATSALSTLADAFGVPFSAESSTVTVVLESQPGRSSASNVAALSALGIRGAAVEATSSLVKVTVSLTELPTLASQLGGVAFIRPPYVPHVLATSTEGVAAIDADLYHAAGHRGAGVKVAVIDLGFSGLTQAQARGDLPYSAVQNDLTGTGLTSGITHGTAVAEIVHDIAPDAQLHLIKIGDEVDLDQAVTYCINNGIDIINHSLGWYNTNFYDGTGTIADIARRATSQGILWVNASGNEAQSHWEGTFVDGNADGWLDQIITFFASAGSPIVTYLTWNEWPQAPTDYDLYILDPSSNVIASSTKHQTGTEEPTESVQISATVSGTYSIRIQGVGSKRLELFNLYQNISPAVASSSILAPANAAEVVTVGAIDVSSYTTGPVEPYSSQGPTNDGRTKPDLCAPDNGTTGTAPYTTFPGTSGAAPHAAGAAALLLSAQPTLTGSALKTQLLAQTIPMGAANVYGNGRLVLQPLTQPNQSPTASFTFSPTSPQVGTSVSFNASGSSDPDGTITLYAWDFDNNGTTDATGITASRSFGAPGTYTVRLTVTDDDGATGTTTRQVSVATVPNQSPTASFTFSPTSPQVGTSVSFNASGSNDPDGFLTLYAWDFDNNGTTDATGITTSRSFGAPGTYTVRLTVTDDDGATGTTTRQVSVATVPNQSPTASFTFSPTSPQVGTSVSFNASGSNDPDGFLTLYAWDFDNNGTTDATGITASRSFGAPGTYTVRLTVTDDDGATGTTTRQVSVATVPNQSPTASFTFSPTSPQVGTSVSFNASGSNDPDGFLTLYAWDFDNNGTTDATGITASRSFGAPGTYTVRLTVTDDDGATGTTTRQVSVATVPNQSPTASFTFSPTSPQVGTSVSFNASGSNDPDGFLTLYAWDFDNNGTTDATGITASRSFGAPGTYTVRLTVTDDDGATGTTTRQVSVQMPTAPDLLIQSLSNSPLNPTIGQSVTFFFTLQNAGNASAGLFRVRLTGTASSTQTYVSQLAAGASQPLNLTLPLTAASETFTVTVDDLNQVSESNESNNTRSITVTAATPAAPVADAGGPYSGTVGVPISFNGTGSSGSITSYQWSFGDGGTASGSTVSHAYGVATTYNVTLTVIGPGGQSTDTTQAFVSPPAIPLSVQVTLPKATYEIGESLTATYTLNRTAYVYLCEATADGRVLLIYPNGFEPNNPVPAGTHTVPSGPYSIQVSEPTGSETLYLFAATSALPNFPTSYGFGFPLLSTNPTTFRNTVLATMQSQLPSTEWSYDTVSYTVVSPAPTTGTLRVLSSPTGATVRLDGSSIGSTPLERTGVSPGVHTVQISRSGYQTEVRQVLISAGATATVQVTLTPEPSNQPPNAAFTYSPSSPTVGEPVQFNATGSNDPDGSIVSYAWDFGDGGSGSGATPVHSFGTNISYTVRLTVTDNGGATDTITKTVSVESSEDIGWVSPVVFEDPAKNWTVEERAYDNDVDTHAYHSTPRGEWTSYLFLDAPEGGVLSDRIRFVIGDNIPSGHAFFWRIDVYRDDEWVQVFEGTPEERTWIEVAFDEGLVTRMRFRSRNDASGQWRARVWEADFRDVTIPLP